MGLSDQIILENPENSVVFPKEFTGDSLNIKGFIVMLLNG
jgi:hypothetical protein